MIEVLVVEDDRLAAEAHRRYVERVPGFAVVDAVHSGAEALRVLDRRPVDLVLLDFYLPDRHGLEICRRLCAAGHLADVIAVTSARDLATVRSAVSVGVVQYLLKPFTFATFRTELERAAGVSRVTARRYLEYLVDYGYAERAPQYGQVGRPELRYRRVTENRPRHTEAP